MAITNVGISDGVSTAWSNGVRVYEGEAGKMVYLHWHTDLGPTVQDGFDIDVYFRTVRMAGSGSSSDYGSWSASHWEYRLASQCNPTGGTSGWDWCVLFDIDNMLQELLGSTNQWKYETRKFDAVHFKVNIKSHYHPGDTDETEVAYSPRTDSEVWIGYFPNYAFAKIEYATKNYIHVNYTAPGWNRTDDRWELESFVQDGQELAPTPKLWGTVYTAGRIRIPCSGLLSYPELSEATVKIRMNAAWRLQGDEFGRVDGTGTVANSTPCNTFTISAVQDDDAVKVTVIDNGDRGMPLETATVKLVGGGLPCDTVETKPGVAAVIQHPPLNVPTNYSVYVESGNGMRTGSTDTPVIVEIEDKAVIGMLDGSKKAKFRYCDVTSKGAAQIETSKKAGRERPSLATGVGGEVGLSVSATAMDRENPLKSFMLAPSLDEIAFYGPSVLRDESGRRWYVGIESASVKISSAKPFPEVSISCTEVS